MPNRNSYFCVHLRDEVVSQLADAASALTAHFRSEGKRVGLPCDFRPMALTDVHVTAIFCGEALRRLSAEQIRSLHAKLGELVADVLDPTQLRLVFAGLAVFPPEKRNLVVAMFTPSAELLALRNAALLEVVSGGALSEAEGRTQAEWVPHATLGKIMASTAALQELALPASEAVAAATPAVGVISARGLCLVGEPSEKIWLDWEMIAHREQ